MRNSVNLGTSPKRGLIPHGIQYRRLREFCDDHEFEPHDTFQLFRRSQNEPWILYRRGLPGQHKLPSGEEYPGWTFDMSLSQKAENALYKCVCLHFVNQLNVPERIAYAAKPDYVAYAQKLDGKRRLYVSAAQRRVFDPEREDFINSLRLYPIFEK